jgi:putative SOS response-associated peptidase YedK
MCERFTIAISVGFYDRFNVSRDSSPSLISHYNINPYQDIPGILCRKEGNRAVALMTWGLVLPSWSKDRHTGHHPINVWGETLTRKPIFYA